MSLGRPAAIVGAAAVGVVIASAPLFASARAEGPWGVAYPPVDARSPHPAIVFLHGMWAGPEDSCAAFERAATRFGFLVCPRGNTPFGDGGTMWTGTFADAARQIEPALTAAGALAPGKLVRARGGTLIGYSNGAYFAAEVACAQPGRWSGLVLLSMKIDLDANGLRSAGVRRVVLAAGDLDDARPSLVDLAQRLAGEGVDARFVSLGPGGHALPPDIADRMVDVVAWVRQGR